MNIPFQPLGDRILVRRCESEEKTSGGIIIPDTAKEKPIKGIVVAVGPGDLKEDGSRQPMDVKEKDEVWFGKWSGTEIKIAGEEFLVMKLSDVIGISK